VYQEKLEQYLRALKEVAARPAPETAPKPAPKPGADAAVVPVSTNSASLTNPERPLGRPPGQASPSQGPTSTGPRQDGSPAAAAVKDAPAGPGSKSLTIGGTVTWRDTRDTKQKARWLLQLAREQILRKQFDAAANTIAEASELNVRWGYFDETPAKMSA